MKTLVISGSRYIWDRFFIETYIEEVVREQGGWLEFDKVVLGDALGADFLALQYMLERRTLPQYKHLTIVRHKALWKKFKRAAGPKRNQRMLDEGESDNTILIAFPYGESYQGNSNGTWDCISRARDKLGDENVFICKAHNCHVFIQDEDRKDFSLDQFNRWLVKARRLYNKFTQASYL